MQALILSAGLGTRLLPLTLTTPKALVDINGHILLDIWLDLLLSNHSCDHIFINAHHHHEQIKHHIAKSLWQDKITYIYEDKLYNTAGSIKKHYHLFHKGKPLLLIHGDNLSKFDIDDFIAYHHHHDSPITMMSFITDSPQQCGILKCDDNNIITMMYEKVKKLPNHLTNKNLANAAIYIIDWQIIEYIATIDHDIIDFSTQIIPLYFGQIRHYINHTYHRDIGTMESLNRARKEWV